MRGIIVCCLILFFTSCTLKEKENLSKKLYIDLNSYFKKEANRLSKINSFIDKTVIINGQKEEKKVKIIDWQKEFEPFISADINKVSWRGEFEIKKDLLKETYTTANEKIPVKEIQLTYKNNKIYSIEISINTTNSLYFSKDNLIYYPDSTYQIKKVQKIKLMDQKVYQVIGKFKTN